MVVPASGFESITIVPPTSRTRSLDMSAVLPPTHGLVLLHGLATYDILQDVQPVLRAIRWRQKGNIPAHCFFRGIAKNSLCSFVPIRNNPIHVDANNCIIRRFDNRSMPQDGYLGPLFLGDVDDHANYAFHLAALVKVGPAMPLHPNHTLIRTDNAVGDLEEGFLGTQPSLYALGVYGTQGVAAASNMPGARWRAVGWTDSNGDFWLFAG